MKHGQTLQANQTCRRTFDTLPTIAFLEKKLA